MFWAWIVTLILFAGSLLSISGFIIERKPNAQELFDKVAPAQGIIGCILILISVFALFKIIPYINYPFGFIALLYPIILFGSLGIILGYSIIEKFLLSRNESAGQIRNASSGSAAKIPNTIGLDGTWH